MVTIGMPHLRLALGEASWFKPLVLLNERNNIKEQKLYDDFLGLFLLIKH